MAESLIEFKEEEPVEEGNIDLTTRPVVQNQDGTVSTERSISIGTEQGEVLIPTIINGTAVSKDDAIKHYKKTGEHLGVFKDVKGATDYANLIHKRREKETATGGSLIEFKQDTADLDIDVAKAAEMLPVSEVTGIPIDELYNNYDEVKTVSKGKKDEGAIRSVQAAMSIGKEELRMADIGWAILSGNDDPNFVFEMEKIEQRIMNERQYITDDNIFEKVANAAAGLVPMAWETGTEGLKTGMLTSMIVGGGTLAVAPPAAPAAFFGSFPIGATAGGAKRIAEIEAGSMYMKLRDLRDADGNPVDPRIIKTFALAVGAINGALEAAQIKLLLKTVPGLDKVMNDLVQKSITKLIKNGSVSAFLLGSAGRYAKFLGGETAVELGQETVGMVMEETVKSVHHLMEGSDIDRMKMEEVMDTWKQTAFASVAGFGVLGAPGHAVHTMSGLIDYRSKVKEERLRNVLPPDTELDYSQEMENTYERLKNLFIGERDLRVLGNKNEGRELQDALDALVGEEQTPLELAAAMQLYRDSKNNPEAVEAALRGEIYEPSEVGEEVPSFLKLKAPGFSEEDIAKLEKDKAEMDLDEIPDVIKEKAPGRVERTPEEEEILRKTTEPVGESKPPTAEEESVVIGELPDVDLTEQVTMPEGKTKPADMTREEFGEKVYLRGINKTFREGGGVPDRGQVRHAKLVSKEKWAGSHPNLYSAGPGGKLYLFDKSDITTRGGADYVKEGSKPLYIIEQEALIEGKDAYEALQIQKAKDKPTGDVEYTSKKGHVYTKREGKWFDSKDREVTNEYKARALDKGSGVEAKPKVKKEPKKTTHPLGETELRLIEMSKNLTQEQKAFVDNIGTMYDAIAKEALGDEIIFNTMNNYVSRSWIFDKKTRDILSRLTQTTIHAKERRLPTIVEGWTHGLTMKSHGIVDNLVGYRDNMIKTIEQKRFIKGMMKGKTDVGDPIFSTERLPNYERIKMPQYTPSKGTTYFAPRDVARRVNNVFGVSKFDESQFIQNLTKLNALLKKIALSTSFFHNIAFMRSFYLGGKTVQWENMNMFTAHREGVEMIHNMDDYVKLGVYNGLTLNLIQDWEEDLLVMGNDIQRITNEYTGSKRIRGLVSDLWKRQVEFTFGVQGAGLKIKAFVYEFENERKRYPKENINKIAARVASLMNDDFGGLHLERLEVDPTYQHIFRLAALAPDWTRSNIRTVTGMFRRAEKGGYAEQRQMYRRFWARVVLKTAVATAMMNVLLAGGDVDEAWKRYKAGVDEDWKNVASVDITGLWGLFGMDTQDRKYLSIAGHFLDPVKYTQLLVGEPKILQYKASIIARLASDWMFNENWRGKRFKNLAEIPLDIGEFVDFLDPDTYVTYAPEKRQGAFLEKNFTFPAILIHSAIGSSPIAFQNLLATLSGEQDWLSGVANTVGIRQPRRKRKQAWK